MIAVKWFVVVLSVVLVGCSSTSIDAPVGPWADEIAKAQRSASTDFERDVLADGSITRDEYQEASQRYVDCMRTAGYDTRAVDPIGAGLFQYQTSVPIGEPDLDDDVSDRCHRGSLDLIEPLYGSLLTNPNREDFDVLVFGCLQRNGFASENLTVSEFKQRYSGKEKPPWNLDDGRVLLCYANPGRG